MAPDTVWMQRYTPWGGLWGSALVAAVPLVLLLVWLGVFRARAMRAALVALVMAVGLAVGVYGMPARMAGMAVLYGGAFGLFPIGWVVLHAMFLYRVSLETGGFDDLQRRLAGISADRRIQALLVAFCFGAFVEGLAGFGAPVAVTGALMIGLGFRPLEAAKLALIGNTAPVAFGSVGIPIVTLSRVTGLDELALSAMVGRQLPWVAMVVPFWLVGAQAGWRGLREVWPVCAVSGGTFAVLQFVVSNYHGPWLVDIVAGLGSSCVTLMWLRVWSPRRIEPVNGGRLREPAAPRLSTARAVLPWGCFAVLVAVTTLGPVRSVLDAFVSFEWTVPGLHERVVRVPPAVAEAHPEPAVYRLNLLSASGTAVGLAAVLSGWALGLGPRRLFRLYVETLLRVRASLATIAVMLALAFVTRYSGSDTTLGLALAASGPWFSFFSPLLGWLGVALTGSDTSSNVLFGHLQKVTAEQLGLSPVMMAAANSAGGVMGKMIDAQSIVVASVATGGRPDSPDVGRVLRAVFLHSVGLALLVAVVVWVQARWFPGVVPGS